MTVYVVQDQTKKDHTTGEIVARFDLTPAKRYGELKFLLRATAKPFSPLPILEELRRGLEDFGDEDYLLLIGNPVIMGMAAAIAADINGTVNFLQWSGKYKKYVIVKVPIFTDLPEG